MQTKAVVTATVLGSGVVDAEDDAARVLVYVNQTSQKAGGDPQIFQNRVTMTMEQGRRPLAGQTTSRATDRPLAEGASPAAITG